MKKYFIIILLFLNVLVSCVEIQPSQPPTITITPDELTEISILKPVIYTVTVFSNEDLKKFKLTSTPTIFVKDTTFGEYSHHLTFSFSLKLPNITYSTYNDSLVTLKFEVSDEFNTTIKTSQLKITQGYPAVINKSIELEAQPDGLMFYSFSADSLYTLANVAKDSAELAFVWHSTYKHVLCSPDAHFLNTVLQEYYPFDNTIMLHTKAQRLYSDWDEIDAKYLYEYVVSEYYINGNLSNGVGVNNCENGYIIGFELIDGRKGALEITNVLKTTNKIYLNIKIQEYAL